MKFFGLEQLLLHKIFQLYLNAFNLKVHFTFNLFCLLEKRLYCCEETNMEYMNYVFEEVLYSMTT